MRDGYDLLHRNLTRLANGYVARNVANPAYVPPVEGQPAPANPEPETIRERFPLTFDQIRSMKYDIRDFCGPVAALLSK
jgi:hypothetical protein